MFDPRKLMDMMSKAGEMQAQFQEELKSKTVQGSAGGGMVKVVMNGQFETLDLQIDESAWAMNDKLFLIDLIKAATNDAARSVREMMATESKSLLGKLGLGA